MEGNETFDFPITRHGHDADLFYQGITLLEVKLYHVKVEIWWKYGITSMGS